MPQDRSGTMPFIAAGVLTIAGASILLAGAAPGDRATPRSAQQATCGGTTRALTTPATTAEPAIIRVRPLADRDAACASSLSARAANRAYDGAPPIIPHDVESFTQTKSCMDCHADGFAMGTRIARAMPHPYLAACEQCHVTQQPPLAAHALTAGTPLPESTFEGLFRTGPSTRAWAEAPPTVPHDLMMRTNCLACHGRLGYAGLQTTHPERTNCVQCHIQADN